MVDFTEEETQALPAVMRALAPEMERIGWNRPLGQLTQNDMHRLIVLTVEAFRAEMAEIADASARNVTEKPKSELERTLRRMAPGLVSQSPDFVKRPLRRAMEAIRPDKTRLTSAQRQQITADLAPDMARLQAEFGVDVARWGF